jgi:hypothetical protein
MNTTTPTLFTFRDHQVRAMQDEHGEPWFVAKDVCEILELEHTTNALNGLDDDELTVEKLQSGGQSREMKLISESGLYTLIIRSNKPQAKPFRKWVTGEVLPSIRKHGSYSLTVDDEEPIGLVTGPAPLTVARLAEAAQGVKAAMIMARAMGYRQEQARRLANQITMELTGVDVLDLLGPADDEPGVALLPLASDQPPVGMADEKSLAAFIEERCELDVAATVSTGDLFRAYCGWFRNKYGEDLHLPGKGQFSRLVNKHFRRGKLQTSAGMVSAYFGVGLANTVCQPAMMGQVEKFVAECCVVEPEFTASATDLYQRFTAWFAERHDVPAPSMKTFGSCLCTLFQRSKLDGRVRYQGLALAGLEVCHE